MGQSEKAIRKLDELKSQIKDIYTVDDFYKWQEFSSMYISSFFSKETDAFARFDFQHLHGVWMLKPDKLEIRIQEAKRWNESFFDAAKEYIRLNGVYKKPKTNPMSEVSSLKMLIYVVLIFGAGFGSRTLVELAIKDKKSTPPAIIDSNFIPQKVPQADTADKYKKNDTNTTHSVTLITAG